MPIQLMLQEFVCPEVTFLTVTQFGLSSGEPRIPFSKRIQNTPFWNSVKREKYQKKTSSGDSIEARG
jgi:hypothetical protein